MSGIKSLYLSPDGKLLELATKPPRIAVIRVGYDDDGPYPVIPVADIHPGSTVVWAAYGRDLEAFEVHFLKESDAVASGAKVDRRCRPLSAALLHPLLHSSDVSAVSLELPASDSNRDKPSVLYYQLHRLPSGPDQQVQGSPMSGSALARAYAIIIRPPRNNS